MIRTEKGDISDELYKNVFEPFNRYMAFYLTEVFLNDYVAKYIATAYKQNAITKCSINQIFKEACESLCQIKAEDCDKKEVLQILKDIHGLEIINENPVNIMELD